MAVQKKGVVDMQQVDKEFFVGFVLEKFDELAELFEEKNKQYSEHDPLANFRTGAKLHGEADYAAMFEEAKAYCASTLHRYMAKARILIPLRWRNLCRILRYTA